ncbi:transglutaminase-like domain-containing protein [Lignipirellula cremea]|uniref:Transglutaminase-like superfamily protein n=1 Tax=Lignipirellula cremea TaxID=2528010 RepID=A0A518E443_9BACT|nr:transglutaminase-like domain-containing protein [Lignipirellula cremea]QDU98849.1 Transglutaminase-like superfamily protein [Lignipirellula cremea]
MTASPTDRLPHSETLLLTFLAASILAVVRIDAAWDATPILIRIACEWVAILGLRILVRRSAEVRQHGAGLATLAVGMAVVLTFLAEAGQRLLLGGGEPVEILLLTSLQLTSMVLAAFSFLPRLAGCSVLLASFLVLFTASMSTPRAAQVLVCVYGMLGLWWLMGAYWSRLEGSFLSSTVESRIPLRVSVLGATGALLAVLATVVGATGSSTRVLSGFMPTSGGNQRHDPCARSGVGDGDALVAAREEAFSFGPVESELFLESEMPSLYDLFDDTYGEPPNRKREQERSIALAPQKRNASEQRTATTQRGGREFSAVRRRVERPRQEMADRDAPAILYVVGQTPLHLALATYDHFDGRQWEPRVDWQEGTEPWLEELAGKPWIAFRRSHAAAIPGKEQTHAIKVINLKANRIPAPPQLTALHIDKVDRVDFFGWTADGMIEMSDRERIPQLTVVRVRSRGFPLALMRRPDRDFSAELPADQKARLAPYLHPGPSEAHGRLEPLAAAWVKGVPRGWLQVEAIVRTLRSEFVLAPDAMPPADCEDVVEHFLQAGKGPDYLFATTAAMLLRSLGYPTRLTTGFYAKPESYDRQAGQTVVLAEDVHVWPEVCIDGIHWVVIEPTPGYQPPRESLNGYQRLVLAWQTSQRLLREHAGLLGVIACCSAIGWWKRVAIADCLLTLLCWLAGRGSPRRRALSTLRLLEWRSWLAGRARPREATIARWHGALVPALPPTAAACLHFTLCSAERLLYASAESSSPGDLDGLQQACAVVERQVGVRYFQNLSGGESQGLLPGAFALRRPPVSSLTPSFAENRSHASH